MSRCLRPATRRRLRSKSATPWCSGVLHALAVACPGCCSPRSSAHPPILASCFFFSDHHRGALRLATVIPNITELHLAHNELTSLKGLERLAFLQFLDVRHNMLSHVVDVAAIVSLPLLNQLLLAGNPLAKGDYRVPVLARFAANPGNHR